MMRGHMQPAKRTPRGAEGLTLIEVMVAMAMLAAGLLAMLTMQVNALRSGRHGKNVTEASQIANQQLEYLENQSWTTMAPVAFQTRVAQGAVNGNGPNQAQTYTVQWQIVQDPGLNNQNLRWIDVSITWVEPGDSPNTPPHVYSVSSYRYNER